MNNCLWSVPIFIGKVTVFRNTEAIDTKGIGEALQRSAASFNAAHTDLSSAIALVTATKQNWLNVQKCA